MPRSPSQISGKIFDVNNVPVQGALVLLTHTSGEISVISNSAGEYILNLGDLNSWTAGDSATITVTCDAKGRKTESITLASGSTLFNITLEETSDLNYPEEMLNQHKLVFSLPVGFDGEKITYANPLPVSQSNTLIQGKYDRVEVTYPTTTTEKYIFKYQNNLVSTVTITYTDATKEYVSLVVKS